ncbi:phage tail tape measure protein [Gordonia sp. SCSIO 19800]|uniref:phage tail tape measure protein n=1 Tax=Gordonia sp. SCSIO 19800 TaxID=2826926 RepID=UPI001B8279EB|nr:phage tail tape measure protein [Gordonia sp. SCSIO 19800]MBR7191918.1 phage tail tape measure protein [Gordonia sp. SCSIO 19800]
MPLDVGKLTAQIGIEGLDAFRTDLRRAGGEFEDFARTTERTGDQARRSFEGAGRGLNDLGQSGRQAAGDIDRAADDMRRSIEEVERESRRAGRGIADDLGNAGQEGGSRFRDGLRGMFDGAAEEAQGAGEGMGGGLVGGITSRLAGAGGPIGGAVAAALAVQVGIPLAAGMKIADQVLAGFESQAAKGQIKATFGWTEAQAAAAGNAAAGAYVNAWGESQAENMRVAGVAIQSGLLDGNATAEQIQPVIEQLSIVSTIMGEEIPEVARAAGQMVKTGMADNVTEAFDLLTTGQQKGLNLSGDLIDTTIEYGTQFRKLGIDGETAFGVISQMSKAGARDTDIAADALKEFSIRAVDGSEATMEAFTALNLNAEETSAAFAKGGESALGMSRVVLTALAQIKDPQERERLGVALLGTQWEDLGEAVASLDLATAGREMEGFGGATKRAGEDMSGALGGIEGMKRSLEVAIGSMQGGLADAFGPSVQELTTWIAEHRTEIIEFFTNLGKVIGVVSGETITFAGAFISAMGYVVKYLGDAGGFILETFGNIAEGIGNTIKDIPGMEGWGNSLIDASKRSDELAQTLYGAGDGMISFGEKVGLAGMKVAELSMKIGELPAGKAITVDMPEGQKTLDMLREMGAKVTTDNEKRIVVEAPMAPEVLQRLKELGIEARVVDNKTVLVSADDAEYHRRKQEWIKDAEKRIKIFAVDGNTGKSVIYNDMFGRGLGVLKDPNAGYSDGGYTGPGGKHQPAGIVHADEFVVKSESRAQLERTHPGWLDYMNRTGALPGYAEGGQVLDSLIAIQRQVAPGLQMTSGVRNEPGSFHHTGQAGDFSNGSSNTPEMLSFANYLADNYRTQLAELIYHDPRFAGRQVDEGQFVPDSFFAGAGDHTNHVHAAAHQPLGAPTGGGGAPIQDVALTAESSREDVARKIIAEGRKRGYSDAEITAILSTAIQESNLSPSAVGGGGAWHGVFQQDTSYPGRSDPNQNIAEFYNRLDAKRSGPGASSDIWKNIFWLQQRPGENGGDAAYANGRQAYLSEIQSRQGEAGQLVAALGPSVGAGVGSASDPSYSSYSGSESYDSYGRFDSGSGQSTPPEDPSVATFTFTNPLEPFWWKGEREYRERIISENEKQKAWDEYVSGTAADRTNGLEKATRDLADAEDKLRVARLKANELAPTAQPSQRELAKQDVAKAEQAVEDARLALEKAQTAANNPGALQGTAPPMQRLAGGGSVHGPGTKTSDDVLIAASAGEFMHQASAVDYYGLAAMHAVNDRRVPKEMLAHFAEGGPIGAGFGGYVHDDSDVMAPKNWRDWMGLATGAGFAAYNLAEPFVNAAVTGKVDLGNITPQLNTGTTDTGMVTGLLSDAAGQLSQQIDELIWAVKEGKNITVKIDGARDPFDRAGLAQKAHGF